MDQTIEPKIRPLVDALNAIDGVRTIASCQGHVSRISRPYVYFHCPPAVAEAMAARLHDLNMQDDTLSYWWHLTAAFNTEHRLCFSLEAPDLDHRRSDLSVFVTFVLGRKKIDRDLSILAASLTQTDPIPANDDAPVAPTPSRWSQGARASLRVVSLLSMLAIVLLLGACGTSNVELQKDGSGTDEMLKSPCACLPVLYDGPDFVWGRG
ncbi:hypothetical protein [Magnetospirillum fulvum]|uniref:Uncharacterized protein n=1 Tax=Magnetospirillum fulvum MGU-K5 TaxID=1316936 RepID=S9TDE3_MAGFU|nr:hypothetical protein [Magnetospirillum fulvum]EPY00246.1 hypothetical protein K678_17086 [Magnetospirillum fulvum MGU-K5]